jgi:ABC-2 type transport system permease protein
MLDAANIYCRYAAISLRGQMQYRASFLMMAAGHFLLTGIEFFGIWAMFHRFGSLRGWTLPEVALLYGLVNVSFALAEGIGRGFDLFPTLVKSGDFDRLLLRPRSTALQVAGLEIQLMRLGRLLQGLIVLAWSIAQLAGTWSPAKVVLLLAAIAGGACLFYGIFVLQATVAFWTVESLELANTLTYGGTETAQYPMTIYRPWFRRFFTVVVPLACANYLPAQAILGRPGADWAGAVWLSPLVGALFMVASLRIWRLGEQHYRSTGS